MLRTTYGVFMFVFASAILLLGQAPETLTGRLVLGSGASTAMNWVYVELAPKQLRRVGIGRAAFDYDNSIPMKLRRCGAGDLKCFLRVAGRVTLTAEADDSGELMASKITVLTLRKGRRVTANKSCTLKVDSQYDQRLAQS